MPPRKHPPPPPEPEPSPASEPPSDVDPPEPSAPAPDAPTPPTDPLILNLLPLPVEKNIYNLIFSAGSKGMWIQDVRTKLTLGTSIVSKHVRLMVAKGVLKEVSDVRHRSKKVLMASGFEPSSEITGGTWYHDGRLDTRAVTAARRSCLRQIEKHGGAATADMIHKGITRDEPSAGYVLDKIKDILRTMVLDKELEEVKSTGQGEFAAVKRGTMCYHVAGDQQGGGMMEGIPCGVCPRIDECSPEGVISPSTCVYYKKWLQMEDF